MSTENFSDISESFCVFPWVHIMTRPHGSMQPCCTSTTELSGQDGIPFNLSEVDIQEIWNSEDYRKIREDMLAGKKISGCSWCYNLEKVGKQSYRQTANAWWARNFPAQIRERVEESRRNHFMVRQNPMSLDLRLGNLCNLQCRSCHPTSSSSLTAEWKRLLQDYPEFRQFWSGKFYDQVGETPRDEILPWFNEDRFWKRIFEFLPEVKSIYITGGEPTMLRGNYVLLEKCVELGYAPQIELMLNTNLTTSSPRFFDTFKSFKMVQLNCSIDAYGKPNEYLRYPSKWEVTDRHVRQLLELPENVSISINPVAQFHNILNLDELFRYVEELRLQRKTGKVFLETIILQMNPAWLEMTLLPQNVRKLAIERIERFAEDSFLYENDEWSRMNIHAVLRVLKNETNPRQEELLKLNKIYTQIHDQSRSMKMKDYFPELYRMLFEAGIY